MKTSINKEFNEKFSMSSSTKERIEKGKININFSTNNNNNNKNNFLEINNLHNTNTGIYKKIKEIQNCTIINVK